MKIRLLLLSGILIFVACVALYPLEKAKSKPFHTNQELAFFKQHTRNPIDSDQYFLTVSNCKGCHGHDPDGLANVDSNGTDVNLYDDWETSMMGLSAIDPFWRAKVSHETILNPNNVDAAQTFCTGCHAPMGHYTAIYHGAPHYTINDLLNDSLGLNGVGCGGCHSIGTNGIGGMFSGNIPYDTSNVEYGPFTDPLEGPMQLYVGLTPTFSEHVSDGSFCSPCHTLISHTLDLSGMPTGGTFVEQATFHEWKNSIYPSQNKTCQKCHMPQVTDPMKIANGYALLEARSPFNQHQFAGGNAFMVNLIKQNKTSLGVTASDAQFDSTIAATMKLLQNSLVVTLSKDTIANDTAYFTVKLENKAGHKFPSGYPSRRAVLQFVMLSDNGDTLFSSGMFNYEQRVINENDQFEPHYNIINSNSQAQIYEMVMADVAGNRTTSLERAATQLKDNRIPPTGFTNTHPAYDTMQIVGVGVSDNDFNKNNNIQGTGNDKVQYRVGLNGFTGHVNVQASVYYQSIPPKWLDEMFTFNSAPIDSFRNMYNNADITPILIETDTLQNIEIITSVAATTNPFKIIRVYPTPTIDGNVYITINGNTQLPGIFLLDESGKQVAIKPKRVGGNLEIQLPNAAGIYYLRLTAGTYKSTFKLLRL